MPTPTTLAHMLSTRQSKPYVLQTTPNLFDHHENAFEVMVERTIREAKDYYKDIKAGKFQKSAFSGLNANKYKLHCIDLLTDE